MNKDPLLSARRHFLSSIAIGAVGAVGSATLGTPGIFAEELVRTPRQILGPFYPNKLLLDTDNDLLIINDSITPAALRHRLLSLTHTSIKRNVLENQPLGEDCPLTFARPNTSAVFP